MYTCVRASVHLSCHFVIQLFRPQDGSIHVILEYMDIGGLDVVSTTIRSTSRLTRSVTQPSLLLWQVVHHWRDVQYDEVIIAAVAFQVHDYLLQDFTQLKVADDVLMGSLLFLQMLWGLAYLHFERRLHRDIKPQNALLSRTGEVG